MSLDSKSLEVIQQTVDIVRNQGRYAPAPGQAGSASFGVVKPFVLQEQLNAGDKADAKLRVPGDDPDDGFDDDETVEVYAGDMPEDHHIETGTAVWCVFYGAWYVISSWGCVKEDEEE